jgi:hypothetical protein
MVGIGAAWDPTVTPEDRSGAEQHEDDGERPGQPRHPVLREEGAEAALRRLALGVAGGG